MKKQLLLLGALAVVMSASAADSEIISETPAGDLHPTVYGVSQRTYLISNGGFGSFENPGYVTSMGGGGFDISGSYTHLKLPTDLRVDRAVVRAWCCRVGAECERCMESGVTPVYDM